MELITGHRYLCRRIRVVAITLAILFPTFSGPVFAQDVLARVGDDNLLYVPFEGRSSVGPVFAEINGIRQPQPVRIVGSNYVVDVPAGLPGSRHDLRLIVEGPRDQQDLGWWLFETSNDRTLTFGSILSDIGVRSTKDGTKGFANGIVRLEFNRNEGQQSGRLVVSRDETSGVAGEDEFTVEDVFLETRFPFFGQDAFARVGNADVGADTLLHDAASRRGLTFGLVRPAGGRTLTAFVMTPDIEPGLDNVLGLSDKDDLVYGLSASLEPSRLNGLRFDIATHRGRARSLPDGGTGNISGSAMSLALPIAGARGDLNFGLATSEWQSDGSSTSTSAKAWEVRSAWRLSDENAYQRNEVSFAFEKIDQGFHSPFNSDLIAGEERISATFETISPTWQSGLTVEMAKTNYNGSPLAPTDRLSSVSFSLFHDPGVFTGGFLNGTTFYLNAGVDWQERLETPAGAAAADDNRFARLSFGFNRVQPNLFWGARVAYDDLKFDTSSASNERKLFAEARLNFSPNPAMSAQVYARAGRRETGGTRFNEAEANLAFIRQSADGLWEAAIEGSYLTSDDPAVQEGRSAIFSVSRDIGESAQLVGEITWGSGRYAPVGTADEGVSVGLFLRTDFGFSKN